MPSKKLTEEEFKKLLAELAKGWEISEIHNFQSESAEQVAERLTNELLARCMLPKKE